MKLNQLSDKPGARKKPIVVGRGIGSGKGKTAGRGGKGQTARSGWSGNGFEGGQMPLHMRMPKRGFNNFSRKRYVVVNLGRLQNFIENGRLNIQETIDARALQVAGVISHARDGVRLLASGALKSKINILVAGASSGAIQAVEKLGGQVSLEQPAEQQEKSAEK
ncbi:MAG: 50S ribosomal protein L15 [Alphaproteobacteria bacterium]|jgi:large subunit ribosomal protein L15|nr:50S ribosomal protein L15 [Alphaproteobacteria bacterium]